MKYRVGKSRLSGKVGNERLITDFPRRMWFGCCAVCVQLHRMRLVRTRLVVVPLRSAASRMRSVRVRSVRIRSLRRMRSVAAPCRIGFTVYIVVCRTGGRKGGTPVLDAVV